MLVPAQVFHPHRDKIWGQQRMQWQCKYTVCRCDRSFELWFGCFLLVTCWVEHSIVWLLCTSAVCCMNVSASRWTPPVFRLQMVYRQIVFHAAEILKCFWGKLVILGYTSYIDLTSWCVISNGLVFRYFWAFCSDIKPVAYALHKQRNGTK